MRPVVIYALIIIAATCLFLGAGSYFATIGIVDHAGNPVDLTCIKCTLILPMFIRISVFAVVGTTVCALAVWLIYRNERRMPNSQLADELDEGNADTNQEIEQSTPEAERSKPKRNFLFLLPKSKVKDAAAE